MLIGDDELSALDPEASRTVEIEQFVDLSEIDPLFYDAAYYAAPDKAARKPYALLLRAMEEQNRVAIARFVMRSKQYLCALRPDNGVLVLSTMVYADEVNDPAELTELEEMDDVEVSDRELLMARQLIDSLTEDFEPARFEDTYRLRVLDLIERKASGDLEVVAPPAPAAEEKLVDLMAALEESVKEAKQARTRHPTSKPSDSKKAAKAEKTPAAAKRRSA